VIKGKANTSILLLMLMMLLIFINKMLLILLSILSDCRSIIDFKANRDGLKVTKLQFIFCRVFKMSFGEQ